MTRPVVSINYTGPHMWLPVEPGADYIERAVQSLSLASPFDAPIYYKAETDSTMTDVRELMQGGIRHGTVVVTDFQAAGRGRLPGRRWVSPPGQSLMMTVALEDPSPASVPLRVGLAVAAALESTFSLEPCIKWPNDILVGQKKVCGILCEFTQPWVLAGIGLNLLQEQFPADLGDATSVRRELVANALPLTIDRDRLIVSVLSGIAATPADWPVEVDRRLWRRGRQVELIEPHGTRVSGLLCGVDDSGLLLIERAGNVSGFAAGELRLISEDGDGP